MWLQSLWTVLVFFSEIEDASTLSLSGRAFYSQLFIFTGMCLDNNEA